MPMDSYSGRDTAPAYGGLVDGGRARTMPVWGRTTTLPSMRVVVDFDVCESNAIFMRVAPEVFLVDDDDNLQILQENPPDELRAKVEEAVRMCPKQAITLEE